MTHSKSALSEYDFNWCSRLIAYIFKWPLTQPFRSPVDPIEDGASDYFEKINNPMDFKTIRNKLNDGLYPALSAFKKDLMLVCENTIKFNGDDSIYALMANDISKWINNQFETKSRTFDEEWDKRVKKAMKDIREHYEKHKPREGASPKAL